MVYCQMADQSLAVAVIAEVDTVVLVVAFVAAVAVAVVVATFLMITTDMLLFHWCLMSSADEQTRHHKNY